MVWCLLAVYKTSDGNNDISYNNDETSNNNGFLFLRIVWLASYNICKLDIYAQFLLHS